MSDKMELKEIYSPVEDELREVEDILETSLKSSRYMSIQRVGNYLLESPGKRIRPALLVLSARASGNGAVSRRRLAELASAMEIIHMASLIHDDIIDRAALRHHRPTLNSKWGEDISIAMGDYLYSLAFGLISKCGNSEVLRCISSAVKVMCEGELLQVWERGNLNLSEKRYILIIKKKTASLFSACCRIGGLVSCSYNSLNKVLEIYGMNLGISFQIIDDYLDLAGEGKRIGKDTGQDIRFGEVTLPILKLWESLPEAEKNQMHSLLASGERRQAIQNIRKRFFDSGADVNIKETVSAYTDSAKDSIAALSDSPYKESLVNLTDFFVARMVMGG